MNGLELAFIFGWFAMATIGYIVMAVDKSHAACGIWRISESSLFCVALFMGAIGETIAMFKLHHKIRKWYFLIGLPLMCVVNLLTAYVFLRIV